MKKMAVIDISLCAAAMALHIILELFCTIRIGNDIKISLSALPFVVTAFLAGPAAGLISGALGSFLSQLLSFGITVTTPLWVLPFALQGLFAGLFFKWQGKKADIRQIAISVYAAGLIAVVFNWIASYVDGVVVFKYMTLEVLLGLIPIRLLVWVIVSVVFTAVSVPLVRILRKQFKR